MEHAPSRKLQADEFTGCVPDVEGRAGSYYLYELLRNRSCVGLIAISFDTVKIIIAHVEPKLAQHGLELPYILRDGEPCGL